MWVIHCLFGFRTVSRVRVVVCKSFSFITATLMEQGYIFSCAAWKRSRSQGNEYNFNIYTSYLKITGAIKITTSTFPVVDFS